MLERGRRGRGRSGRGKSGVQVPPPRERPLPPSGIGGVTSALPPPPSPWRAPRQHHTVARDSAPAHDVSLPRRFLGRVALASLPRARAPPRASSGRPRLPSRGRETAIRSPDGAALGLTTCRVKIQQDYALAKRETRKKGEAERTVQTQESQALDVWSRPASCWRSKKSPLPERCLTASEIAVLITGCSRHLARPRAGVRFRVPATRPARRGLTFCHKGPVRFAARLQVNFAPGNHFSIRAVNWASFRVPGGVCPSRLLLISLAPQTFKSRRRKRTEARVQLDSPSSWSGRESRPSSPALSPGPKGGV